MRYNYSFLCECGWEYVNLPSAKAAREEARYHVAHDSRCDISNPTVFIDEYDSEGGDDGGGELSGRYWKLRVRRKATPASLAKA